MYDFIRAVCAVPDISVGDPGFNTRSIIEKMQEAAKDNGDIMVFPELCLTGYTAGDLFFQQRLLCEAAKGIAVIARESRRYDCLFAIGAPLEVGGSLYNCAFVIYKGKILGIVPKTFLPNYSEYYEKRWFSSALSLREKTVKLSHIDPSCGDDYDIPIGGDLLFDYKGQAKIGVEICEDLWTPLPPSTLLALRGGEVILNLSASNETIAKRSYRRQVVTQQSAGLFCGYVYVSAGETESTQDLIFSGHSLIAQNGMLLKENNKIIDTDYYLAADIDLGKIRADRLKNKSFSESGSVYAASAEVRAIAAGARGADLGGNGDLCHINRRPFVPSDEKDRLERCLGIFEMQTAGLRKRLSVTGCKAVIGVSGGLDSTLALLVCAYAMKTMGRPMTEVIAVTLPGFGTTDRTYNNAIALMKALGVTLKEVNISEACTIHFRDIGHDINVLDATYENAQARERTQILMDIAGEFGGLVVGTGDLSELALGWCTYNADHMSMYGVNCGIPKTLIKWMISAIAAENVFAGCTETLLDIIDTPISPELLPPDKEGNIAQETEDLVGPYLLHDFFLYYVLRYGFTPKKIYRLAVKAFEGEFSPEIILKWLRVFYRRFFSQQFKRSCLPDGVKIGSVCLSPRGDWRMPSDASGKAWLSELDEL